MSTSWQRLSPSNKCLKAQPRIALWDVRADMDHAAGSTSALLARPCSASAHLCIGLLDCPLHIVPLTHELATAHVSVHEGYRAGMHTVGEGRMSIAKGITARL